jgi:hypothetical protein
MVPIRVANRPFLTELLTLTKRSPPQALAATLSAQSDEKPRTTRPPALREA